MSLDGYSAGPDQTLSEPLGRGGMRLHTWAFEEAHNRQSHGMEGGEVNASTPVMVDATANIGAVVMGRKMFGGGPGPWNEEEPWRGWWGDNPVFHTPVFVLTNHPRESVPMEGGTTFHFVTDGIESAIAQAREAAGELDVSVAGGASTVQQAIRAGLLDELLIHLAPVVLGGGESLLGGLDPEATGFEIVSVVDAPGVTHLTYRVVR
jgi:dihydrofolate reductase